MLGASAGPLQDRPAKTSLVASQIQDQDIPVFKLVGLPEEGFHFRPSRGKTSHSNYRDALLLGGAIKIRTKDS